MSARTYYRLVAGFALLAAGVVVAVVGYLGVSRELEVAFQVPYLASAGVAALLLFGGGAALLLSVQLQRDSQQLDELERAVRELSAALGRMADELSPPERGRDRSAQVSSPNGRTSSRTGAPTS